MYKDRKSGRILLRNGVSMVDSFSFARNILEGKQISDTKVAEDFHSLTYDYLNNTSISEPCVEVNPLPSESHQHTEDDVLFLRELLLNSPRYDGSDEMRERIEEELSFFERTLNILFVLYCVDLIESFKQNGVVWGVGRGSSCASLIFFLLDITDVNPLKYGIKFHELSKEM